MEYCPGGDLHHRRLADCQRSFILTTCYVIILQAWLVIDNFVERTKESSILKGALAPNCLKSGLFTSLQWTGWHWLTDVHFSCCFFHVVLTPDLWIFQFSMKYQGIALCPRERPGTLGREDTQLTADHSLPRCHFEAGWLWGVLQSHGAVYWMGRDSQLSASECHYPQSGTINPQRVLDFANLKILCLFVIVLVNINWMWDIQTQQRTTMVRRAAYLKWWNRKLWIQRMTTPKGAVLIWSPTSGHTMTPPFKKLSGPSTTSSNVQLRMAWHQ